ncbi:ornithine cyclodeaminase [Alteribacillus sp. YIM 98480]|uniref:ornithine cyclodeaminase n=1 Tax=Alteribacillus sp. YIM 98480 TaxID=2606599 RepID=UPI00131C9E6E|nr:ornithine cyclodeaminase [Alteribacillus sp. YIM 98480]
MSELKTLFLDQSDVKKCGGGNISKFIETMEEVFSLHDKGDYILPNKTVLRWGDMDSESQTGRINSMPGFIGGKFNTSGIKWISSSPNNPFKHHLPRAAGIIILNDPETLMPVTVMDGTLISAMRTGANSGVVAKYMAKKNSKVLGLIGAGVQNRTQLMAIYHTVPTLEKVKITDLNAERAKNFANEMKKVIPLPFEIVNSAEEAVRESDIFITATVTETPIVKSEWIKEGSLYIHVGSHECEFDVINQSNKVVVDDWGELKHRGVETISIMYKENEFDETNLYAELGEIVNGKKAGRENDTEKIYFNSCGLGIQDLAIAKIVYEKAIRENHGQWISFWDQPSFV